MSKSDEQGGKPYLGLDWVSEEQRGSRDERPAPDSVAGEYKPWAEPEPDVE